MKVVCPVCRRPVPGDSIDIASGRALCRPCGELILLPSGDALARASGADDLARHVPDDLAWREESAGGVATFTFRRSGWHAAPMLLFSLAWCALVAVMMIEWLSRGRGGGALFALPHAVIGVALAYWSAREVLNHTRVTLGGDRFSVAHAPIRARGDALDTAAIERFAVGEARALVGTWRRGGAMPAGVRALLRDGRSVRLHVAFAREEHAAFVAARLNAALEELRAAHGYRG